MIDWSSCPAVERDSERYSGAWLFRGTRVPVAALFENLEADAPVHEFIEWFPGVTREQVRAVLDHAARSALTAAQMRVVFDQGTPVPLRRAMPHHEVATAFELGWSTLRNGELLSAAETAGFAVFVTTDTNLRYQQNLAARRISIVVLTSTSWPRIRAVTADVVAAVDQAASVLYAEVTIP